jgi:surfeit locus 1 family protein
MERNAAKNATGNGDGAERPDYRFVLRPKWILSHLLVLLLVVLMVGLGFWQLRRLDERKELNAAVRDNASAEPIALPQNLTDDEVDDFVWRPVLVEGEYRREDDVLVANRTLDGLPGYWLVTPLDPADGSATVAVVRGFVTRTLVAEGDVAEAVAPNGEVRVTGYVQTSRGGGRFATGDEGAFPEITRVDLGELGERWDTELAPLWLQLEEQAPPIATDTLTPVPLPPQDDGPHLSYAIQWFIFSAIAVIGYPLILRRNARARDDDEDDAAALATTGVRADGGIR